MIVMDYDFSPLKVETCCFLCYNFLKLSWRLELCVYISCNFFICMLRPKFHIPWKDCIDLFYCHTDYVKSRFKNTLHFALKVLFLNVLHYFLCWSKIFKLCFAKYFICTIWLMKTCFCSIKFNYYLRYCCEISVHIWLFFNIDMLNWCGSFSK